MESEVADESPKTPPSKKKTKRRGRRLTGLSKQRRIANTRERNRVHTINDCIDRLRDLIPLFPHERRRVSSTCTEVTMENVDNHIPPSLCIEC